MKNDRNSVLFNVEKVDMKSINVKKAPATSSRTEPQALPITSQTLPKNEEKQDSNQFMNAKQDVSEALSIINNNNNVNIKTSAPINVSPHPPHLCESNS